MEKPPTGCGIGLAAQELIVPLAMPYELGRPMFHGVTGLGYMQSSPGQCIL